MLSFISIYFYPYSSGIISLFACFLIIPFVIKIANKQNWVVMPRSDRWHKKPVALMGGIGIFLSFSISFLINFNQITGLIYAGCLVMFLIGLVDDLKEVKPVVKLVGQIMCSMVLVYHGYVFGGGLLAWAGIPLTFIWVIGITNAINLLDNMDGLASGIVFIISLISGILNVVIGQYEVAAMAFAIAGSTLGFLVYNFNPAKIFMGDSGSLFLGFAVAFLGVSIQKNAGSSSAILMLLVPISLMAIPIMDTTLVTVKRLFAGRRIDQGGKDHTSHRLVALGLSERKAVLILYIVSALWGVLCILLFKTSINNLLLSFVLLAIFSIVFSMLLSQVKVYNESEEKLIYLRNRGEKIGDNLFLRFFLFNKKLIVGVCTDILIIYCSFFIAANSVNINVDKGYFILALFICVKVSLFYISNLYYRMWRYMAIMELSGYFMASLLSSVILLTALYFKGRLSIYNFHFFFFDFLITFTGIIFSRLMYRLIREFINKNKQFTKRVMIYGAGDSGYLLMKELLQNNKYGFTPVGWIDDDTSKHNMLLYGLKIYGDADKILDTCKKNNASLLLISTNSIDANREAELRKTLAAEDIQVGRFKMSLYFE